MVKLELNLPWKPILAWPWGVKYIINTNTYLIIKHEESWDIEPWEVRNVQVNNNVIVITTVADFF